MVKMILIAYHLLESSIGAYIQWLVNELMLTANKIEYKDARLVMLLQMQAIQYSLSTVQHRSKN